MISSLFFERKHSPNTWMRPVGTYMTDRENASYELFLFLEHVPYSLEAWLHAHPHTLQRSLNDLFATIDFLRKKGIIHFDLHFRNVLADDQQIYLTDFGLALDQNFALTKDENVFFEKNAFYDYGEVLRNLGQLIREPYRLCTQDNKRRIMENYKVTEDLQPHQQEAILLDNIEQIQTDGTITLDEGYVANIVKYRRIITLMRIFFIDIWSNHSKDTPFPHEALRSLLQATNLIAAE